MSKFVHKFCLILLALPVINSFCMDSEKKFNACQKFSSGGAARMSKKEMIENFMQCAGITDHKSRKIIENKLNPAERNSNVDRLQKRMLEFGRISSTGTLLVSAVGFFGSVLGFSSCQGKSFGKGALAGFGGLVVFGILDSYHKAVRMNHEKG